MADTRAYNQITLAEKFIPEIEKKIVQEAKTGFLADNVWKARFVGAKTVIVPTITTPGLGDYTRDTNTLGYAKGNISTTNITYTLEKDRSRQLHIDAVDADESGISDLVGKTVADFTQNGIIPEVDSYNISKLYGSIPSGATAQKINYGADGAKPVDQFLQALNLAEAATEYGNEKMVAFVDPIMYGALMTDPTISRQIVVSNFAQGNIDLRVKEINGVTLIPVTENRMRGAYDFNPGTNLEAGGVTPSNNAAHVRALILPRSAAAFIKKVDKVQVLTPDQVEDMDAYKINFRMYYGTIVKKAYENTIFAIKSDASGT